MLHTTLIISSDGLGNETGRTKCRENSPYESFGPISPAAFFARRVVFDVLVPAIVSVPRVRLFRLQPVYPRSLGIPASHVAAFRLARAAAYRPRRRPDSPP